MPMATSVATNVIHFFRHIEFNVLKRPRTKKELRNRLLIVAAMVLAGFLPSLITPSTDSIDDVAGAAFTADITALNAAQNELDSLRASGTDDGASAAALEQRIQDLETATFIGYIEREGDAPKAGAIAPDFRLLNLQGDPVQLSQLGKPVVLNFWASWCAFCIEEMPDFQRLQEQVGDRATVIGINRAESRATAERFADQTGARYTLLLDLDDELGDASGPYQVIGMPTTLYIRADGVVDTVKVGFHELDEMFALTSNLLDEELAIETEPVDASFGALIANTIDSQFANHAVARELFARFAADPTIATDIAWQRNIVAQTRAWVVNLNELRALTPPEAISVLFTDLVQTFEVLETAAGLLQAGIGDGSTAPDPEQIQRGIDLFRDAVVGFEQAADNLTGVIATQ
jgi:thiol-disulfide isomerase/thioredoxin